MVVCRAEGCRNDPASRGLCAAHVELAAYQARDARRARERDRRRDRETPHYMGAVRSQGTALARRVGASGDIEALADLVAVHADLGAAIGGAVTELRDRHGFSWSDIGRVLGVSRQAAQQRFAVKGELTETPVNPGLTTDGEQRSA